MLDREQEKRRLKKSIWWSNFMLQFGLPAIFTIIILILISL